MNRLDGKVALISGAARGIGAETARLMVEAGAKVMVADVLGERGRETVRTLGDAAPYVHLDVTSEEDWRAAVAGAVDRFGKLDILVNNAGLFLGRDIETARLAEWERLSAVNLTGVFLGTKLCLPVLRDAARHSEHGSVIVNTASTAGFVGSTQDPLYSMTKGGVTLFTKSAALEFARKDYRIRVNSIHPGTIDTDMGDQVLVTRARNLGTDDMEASRRQVIQRLPIGRMGTPNDIAKGIVFLASDDAAFMTGAGLVTDGGITAQYETMPVASDAAVGSSRHPRALREISMAEVNLSDPARIERLECRLRALEDAEAIRNLRARWRVSARSVGLCRASEGRVTDLTPVAQP
jgi:NAD(P)-dependent dehydrogenase (short-subunit alcohol dehydrogenase family)